MSIAIFSELSKARVPILTTTHGATRKTLRSIFGERAVPISCVRDNVREIAAEPGINLDLIYGWRSEDLWVREFSGEGDAAKNQVQIPSGEDGIEMRAMSDTFEMDHFPLALDIEGGEKEELNTNSFYAFCVCRTLKLDMQSNLLRAKWFQV